MRARELLQAGRLDAAIDALGAELRDDPTDTQRRTFLFELLCFAGQYERAEKHLDLLSQSGPGAGMGALLYRSALHADRTRQEMFSDGGIPPGSPASRTVSGTLNGTPFESITDADPRVGARLEVYVAGQYTLIPFEHLASLRMEQPRRLRDLLWAPAIVRAGESLRGTDLGEVLLPVISPRAAFDSDNDVRLGRITIWRELDADLVAPIGQKLLLLDGEEFPYLEVRELEIAPAPSEAA
jgi:type VI secretion system protein ImpE